MRSMKTKTTRASKPGRARKAAHAKKATEQRWWTSPPAVTTAVVGVLAATMLVAAYQASPENPTVANANAKVAEHAQATPPDTPAVARDLSHELVPSAPATATPTDAAGAPAESDAAAAPVTIIGCLERDDQAFRLKDAAGIGVPKTRSWKSGFLKKSPASIEVVDPAKRMKLTNHVGERVSVTGTIANRKMNVASLRRVASSCDGSVKAAL